VTFAKSAWFRAVLAGIAAGILVAVASLIDPGGAFETVALQALNAQFTARGPEVPASPIVIVAIDEDSFDELHLTWPWPRALHAQLIDTISAAGPAAIGLDIVFAEPSLHGEADDEVLAGAIARAGTVVLGAAFTDVRGMGFAKQDLNPPIRPVRDGAAGWGIVGFGIDPDAFIRRATLTYPFQGRSLDAFTVPLYRLATSSGIRAAPLPAAPTVDEARAPAEVIINFQGGPRTFLRVPYYQVLSGDVPPGTFTGKIVLVGATSPVLHDVYPTPFAPHGTMPGVEIHANVLETLLLGIPIRAMPRGAIFLATVLAGGLASWLVAAVRWPMVAAGVVIGIGAIAVAVTQAAFLWWRWWVPVVPPLVALAVAYGASTVASVIREQRQRRRLSRFFSPAVVSEIMRNDEDRLASRRRRVTVLFSDIRGFTAMSERMEPEKIVRFLREYLTVMTEVVFRNGGTVDKYIGDAIMALYNAPFDQPDHAARAVRTALEFQGRLREVIAGFDDRALTDLHCGVGINTGDAVVGTIGSEQRLEYTAIGDAINLGARLEALTREHRVPILISESTYQEVAGEFLVRDLGAVPVRGKAAPVKIYAVLGPADQPGVSTLPVPAARMAPASTTTAPLTST
jgi:adenylate cyclase